MKMIYEKNPEAQKSRYTVPLMWLFIAKNSTMCVFYEVTFISPVASRQRRPYVSLPETEFLDIIETKNSKVFLFAIHCHLY